MTAGSIPPCADGTTGDASCYFNVAYGSPDMPVRGYTFGVDGSGNAAVIVSIVAGLNGSGSYSAAVTLKRADGTNGAAISGSPTAVTVVATLGSYVSTGSSFDVGSLFVPGTNRILTITLKDQKGSFINFNSLPACWSGVTNDASCHFKLKFTGGAGIGTPTFTFGKDSNNRARVLASFNVGTTAAGTYSVSVILRRADGSDGPAITGSPKYFTVARAVSNLSTIYSPSSFEAGSTGSLAIHLKDQAGNDVEMASIPDCPNKVAGDPTCYFNVAFTDSGITSPQFIFSDDGSGFATILISFNIPATSVGSFSVSVYLKTATGTSGALVSGAAQAYTVPARISVRSTIDVAGIPSYSIGDQSFVITLRDQGGNYMTSIPDCPNGDEATTSCFFHVSFTDPAITLTDLSFGSTGGQNAHAIVTATINVGTTALGSYQTRVVLKTDTGADGSAITNSPLIFGVPAIVDATSSMSLGNSFKAGSTGSLTISLKNQKGGLIASNAIPMCPSGVSGDASCYFSVSFSDSGVTTSGYTFGNDGSGHATVVVAFDVKTDAIGSYTATAVLLQADGSEGVQISGSPESFVVPEAVAFESIVTGPETITAGTTGSITIALRDQVDEPILKDSIPSCPNGNTNDASCYFNVEFDRNGIDSPSVAFSDDESQYASVIVSFDVPADAVGSYSVSVHMRESDGSNGAALTSSPVTFTVPAYVSDKSSIDTTQTIAVGSSSVLTIYLKDQGGNYISPSSVPPCPNGDDASGSCFFDITFSDINAISVTDLQLSSTEGNNPRATIVASLNVAATAYGAYTATVTMKTGTQGAIDSSPRQFSIGSVVSARSTATIAQSLRPGSSVTFMITLLDQTGAVVPTAAVPACSNDVTGDASCYFDAVFSDSNIEAPTFAFAGTASGARISVTFTVPSDSLGAFTINLTDKRTGAQLDALSYNVGQAVGSTSTASLASATFGAGSTGSLSIVLKDQIGDDIATDSVPSCADGTTGDASCFFNVRFSGTMGTSVFAFEDSNPDNAAIVYSFSIPSTAIGAYTVTVYLRNRDGSNGAMIGTAMGFTVPVIVSSLSTLTGKPSYPTGTAGALAIVLKDQAGGYFAPNAVPACLSGTTGVASCYFAVSFNGTGVAVSAFSFGTDNEGHAIVVVRLNVTASTLGQFAATALLKKADGTGGAAIAQSGLSFAIGQMVSASSTVSGGATFAAGSNGTLTILLRDQKGSYINAGAQPLCPNGSPVGAEPSCYFAVSFNKTGAATPTFRFGNDGAGHATVVVSFGVNTTAVGGFKATVVLKNADGSNGPALATSQVTFAVPAIISASSIVSGPATVNFNSSGNITILLKDQGGNFVRPNAIPKCASGAAVASCQVKVTFNSTLITVGTYSYGNDGRNNATIVVPFKAGTTAVGNFRATVTLLNAAGTAGAALTGSPYLVRVLPKPTKTATTSAPTKPTTKTTTTTKKPVTTVRR